MDYCLADGDGAASFWSGHPDIDLDGDGVFDSVRMDLDGDGLFDDALTDDDGDGVGDHAALDLDDDGVPEARYTDDGSGTWSVGGGSAGVSGPLRWSDLDGVDHTDGPADVDADGTVDRLLDVNRDGRADRVLVGDGTGYVDTDGDGMWDLALRDADGDGAADAASRV